MKKETLTTIAQRTGCSITTVSRVLNGNAEKYRISKATCEKVRKEADHCNYKPSIIVQNLRIQKSQMVGLLIPSVSNPYFAEVANYVIASLHKNGYQTIILDTMENKDTFQEGLKALLDRQVDGIIAVPCGDDPSEMEYFSRRCPIVTLDRYYVNSPLPFVSTNNYVGGREGTEKLIDRGYKRIVLIQGNHDSTPNKERVRGYADAMKNAGLEEYISMVGDSFTIQNGYFETKLLLCGKERPEALFPLSNLILLGTLKAIQEAKLRIPQDIAILSFDQNIYLDFMTPPIARISQPIEDMASLAVKILLDRISGQNLTNSQILLAPTYLPGSSI